MEVLELARWLLERGLAFLLDERAKQTYITLISIFSITLLMEIVLRKNWRARYAAKSFRLDVLYFLFYYGGFYHLLVFIPLYSVLTAGVRTYAPGLQMNLLQSVSPVWQLAIAVVVTDVVGYFVHRLKHSVPFLWNFHAVHHSQEQLTVMTNYRFHVVDETLTRLAAFIPFQMLGTDFRIWLAVDFAMAWILLLQHTEWNWTYGKLGRLIVSPRFHQIHHSTPAEHQNRNFSMLFSVWDDLFGTAERTAPMPARFGIAPDHMPETFFGQFAWPFVRLVRQWRPTAPIVPVAQPRTE